MKIVGLTGGIGSGKSTIAKMFEELNVPVYYADEEAKKLMTTSKNIKNKIIELLGNKSYIDGKLNKIFIAQEIFNNKSKLNKINKIVHPEVEKHFKKWILKHKNLKYLIQENALIFEGNNRANFDFIILVTAPKIERIKRVILRDKSTKENVLERMKNQLDDDFKIKQSSFIISNIDKEQSRLDVLRIHNELIKK